MTEAGRDGEAGRRILADLEGAVGRGDLPGAFRLAETALAQGWEHPLLFKLRGAAREQSGRLAEAAADFRRALAAEPEDAAALNALGACLSRLGRPLEAIPLLERAVALQPEFAAAHINLGLAQEGVGALRAAEAAYAAARRCDQSNPQPAGQLAVLAARRRDYPRAELEAKAALGMDAAQPAAHLAMGMAELGQGHPDLAQARIEQLLSQGRLSPHSRSTALGLLGDAFDELGRPAAAFDAYLRANQAVREVYAPRFEGAAGGYALARGLHRTLEAIAPQTAANPAESPVRSHVFLVGFPRSGTTLLGQILASHPQITTLDERDTLADAANAFMRPPERLADIFALKEEGLARWRALYWRRVEAAGVRPNGGIFVDKLPMNTLGLPLVARLFPQAKILVLQRDPRDVVLSCFRRNFVINPATWEFLTLEGAARFYDAVMAFNVLAGSRLAQDVFTLRYEDLVQNFESQARSVCDFLDAPWSEDMQRFADRIGQGDVATPSAAQIARGLYTEGVGQWRRFEAQLGPVAPLLQPWVDRFGYGGAAAE